MNVDELVKPYETLQVSWDRGVLQVTLNAPKTRNALSSRMLAELADVLAGVEAAAPGVRAVVITGADPAFCSGMDLRERTGGQVAAGHPLMHLVHAMRQLPAPTIARVNGAARAGGIVLAVACDIAIAEPSATFSMTETRLGLTPEMTLATITGEVAPRLLRRYALTAEVFDAAQAERMGLLSQVSEPGELDAAVGGVLDALRSCSPVALAATKRRLADRASFADLDTLLAAADASTATFATDEAQAGIAAARARQPAPWAL